MTWRKYAILVHAAVNGVLGAACLHFSTGHCYWSRIISHILGYGLRWRTMLVVVLVDTMLHFVDHLRGVDINTTRWHTYGFTCLYARRTAAACVCTIYANSSCWTATSQSVSHRAHSHMFPFRYKHINTRTPEVGWHSFILIHTHTNNTST